MTMAEQTDVLAVDPLEPDPQAINRAAGTIREGGLVVLPTDTVYGITCHPRQAAAVDRIYAVKNRRRELPLALLLRDMSQVTQYVSDIPESAVEAMQRFWPGPLTCVLADESPATELVRSGRTTLGLRLPAHIVPRLVAQRAGTALASTSANRSGASSPVTAEQALDQLSGLVDLVLDAGPTPLGRESTVVSFVSEPPEVVRPGALPTARLRQVLGRIHGNEPPNSTKR